MNIVAEGHLPSYNTTATKTARVPAHASILVEKGPAKEATDDPGVSAGLPSPAPEDADGDAGATDTLPLVEFAVTDGDVAFMARFATRTFSALSSCPSPIFPSYPRVHCNPQSVLFEPPVQEAAAPRAEACRRVAMASWVKGATRAVAPIHWAAMPLYIGCSELQVFGGSQAVSTIMLDGGKKTSVMAERWPWVRFRQGEGPVVCHMVIRCVLLEMLLMWPGEKGAA